MKYGFFAILFANIVFFLWEFHYGALEPEQTKVAVIENGEKQILLLSEVRGRAASVSPQIEATVPMQYPLGITGQINGLAATTQQQGVNTRSAPYSLQQDQTGPANISNGMLSVPAAQFALQQAPHQTTAESREASGNTADAESAKLPAGQQGEVAVNAGSSTPPEPVVPASPGQAGKPPATHTICYGLGPLPEAGVLQTLLEMYRPQLTGLQLITREQRKNSSYWVYYPVAETADAAKAALEKLKSAYGIRDALILRDGELKNAISLGVFSNEQRAQAAQQQFAQKGLQVEIKPRYPAATHYYVQAAWNNEQNAAAAQLWQALRKNHPKTKKTASTCFN